MCTMFKSVLAASLLGAASAHQNWHQIWVNGVSPGYQVGIRMPPSNSPVTDVTSNDIACNVGGTDGTGVETIDASEGDSIIVGWDVSGHPGPITHFLYGPVTSASAATGVGSWTKIDERDYVDGQWANELLAANGGNYTFALPTGLESGEYLLRSEMLALHGAQTVGGAQFYIGCAQLKITGTGGGCNPSIELPGAYGAEDDNIYIPDVYNGFDPTTYSAPGGAVAVCGAGGSAPSATSKPAASATGVASATATAEPTTSAVQPTTSAVQPTTTSAVQQPTTSAVQQQPTTTTAVQPTTLATVTRAPTTATTAKASSTAAGAPVASQPAAGVVSLYGQCGGINYSGATACAAGSQCTKYNDYYSQCVAN